MTEGAGTHRATGSRRLVVFPAWRSNPYLTISHLAARGRGFEVRGATDLSALDRAMDGLGAGDVLHMHWTRPVCQDGIDHEDAARRLEHFEGRLDRFRGDGGRIVWTVHNALPHELSFAGLERDLYRYLARVSDLVHVMNPATADVVSATCELDPARTVVIPHPSYQGVYAARQSDRPAARRALGIPADRPTAMFFGMMRPYKGVETFLDAVARLVADGHEAPVLLLAGSTSPEMKQVVDARLPRGVDVVREHGFVPDDEVEQWYGAADLAVLPYRAILNSGSVHLAATFGVPSVLPAAPHLQAHLGEEPWIRWFDPDRAVESLAEVLADPRSYERDVVAMRAFSDRVSPWRVSRVLADALESLSPPPPVSA